MSRRTILVLLAALVSLPGLIICANFTCFALIGHGFLPDPGSRADAARGVVFIFSVVVGAGLTALALEF